MLSLRAVLVVCCASLAAAQIPNFGWCPEYAPMPDFDMSRFMGVWYEAERYFTLVEMASRCVTTNYTQGLDGRFHVSNQITSRFTGIKRIVDGELRSVGKAGEGKLTVKYSTLPVSFDTTFSVLETDYDSYAVMWTCSGLGPIHTENAWVMTRERLAPGTVLQRAYGVLDKYKISRTFFVKTDQVDCAFIEASASDHGAPAVEEEEEDIDATNTKSNKPVVEVAAVHVAQVVDPSLVVPHDEPVVAPVAVAPSDAMVPPSPIVEPVVEDVVKAEVVAEPVVAPVVAEAVVPIVEAVVPVVDVVRAEEPVVEAVEAVKPVETIVPQIPAKVLAAKNQIRKKTHA